MKTNLKIWAWYAYDMGNSAHALMISTVGFALYFSQYLLKSHPNADFLWGIITAFILLMAAIASPIITSWCANKYKLGRALSFLTLICVFATGTLFFPWDNNSLFIISLYVISALTYYLALPIYNSFLPTLSGSNIQETSAKGWALGYLGGIGIVILSLFFGLLNSPVATRPDLYRTIFLISAIYNFLLSLPLLIIAWNLDKTELENKVTWDFNKVIEILKKKEILQILIAYWLVGEGATVILYYTAIFLAQFASMQAPQIFTLTLIVQGVAIVSTYIFGKIAGRAHAKEIFIIICLIWITIPFFLFLISRGMSYWFPLLLVGLVLGSYHSIVRGKIGEYSGTLKNRTKEGSLWGFLEVAGRISQILGPLVVGIVSLFLPLNYAIISASIFPIIAILVIRSYKWE